MILFFLIVNFSLNFCLEKSLAELSEEFGTDKGKSCHNYIPHYENVLKRFRNQEVKFLEIGYYKGASARMWDAYFTGHAQLHFIDIDQSCYNLMQGLSNRCHLHIVHQENPEEISKFIKQVNGDFDIIVDDGGHHMHEQINSFQLLFTHLKPGGVYIVEDLHTSYWSEFGANVKLSRDETMGSKDPSPFFIAKNSTVDFLLSLAHRLNYFAVRNNCADPKKFPTDRVQELDYYQKYIESIQFFPSLCVVYKK